MNEFEKAVTALTNDGHIVEADELPGLYWVNGRELTAAQVIYVANNPQYIPGQRMVWR